MARVAAGAAAAALIATACTTIAPRVEPAAEAGSGAARAEARFSHAELDALLTRFVDAEGRVDYRALEAGRAQLDRYYARLARASPDNHPELFPSEAHRLAYWINAYNAAVLVLVLEAYPIASVNDVRPAWGVRLPQGAGFFLQRVTLGGESVSLYGLENSVVRRRFADPRIHFALSCASLGCPRLPRRAFHGERLDDELEREAAAFLAEPRNLGVDPAARTIRLSAIFDWYERDFTDFVHATQPGTDATLLDYVASALDRHDPARAAELRACSDCAVEFADYDWGLNERIPAP